MITTIHVIVGNALYFHDNLHSRGTQVPISYLYVQQLCVYDITVHAVGKLYCPNAQQDTCTVTKMVHN